MQWSKPVNVDLRRERQKASFDTWKLTTEIYASEFLPLQTIEEHMKLVASDPAFRAEDIWWLSRDERYTRACERGRAFVKIVRQRNIPFEDRGALQLLLGEDCFILLHDVMFVPTLLNLADDEQQSWWLQKAMNYEILGTYAQTELTHGSNVRGLNTTATFQPPDAAFPEGSWLVHTPSLEAVKWWPGGMARSANTVVLMAQVVINGKNYGPHPFFFPIRDWETHEPLPGIELRDIGQKIGYNGMDNGALWISNVRIPRRHLLMRYVDVDISGKYSKKGNEKMLFGTMTYTRMKISYMSGFNLAKAVTSAVRYSAVRRQFEMSREDAESLPEPNTSKSRAMIGNSHRGSSVECQVLDYSSQQFILFPQLALSFAMHFAALSMEQLYFANLKSFKAGDFSGLQELHIVTCTSKAVHTMLMSDGMEQCRKSMGGHGFLNAAGVGPQYLSALPQATYEGDFIVLSIQVGTQILKTIGAKMRGKTVRAASLQYIVAYDPFAERVPLEREALAELFAKHDHAALIGLLESRANFLHYAAAEQFQEMMAELGGAKHAAPLAIDDVKIDFIGMAYAHAYVYLAKCFAEKVASVQDPATSKALSSLVELFILMVLTTSYERGGGFGDFVAAQALAPGCYLELRAQQRRLLREIRPDAVSLVDAWNIPDFLLNSCLGRYDGRVYEALWESTRFEPLNKTDIHEGYYKHLQYLMHGPDGAPRSAAQQAKAKL